MHDDDHITNPTDNRPFADVLQTAISRRTVLRGGFAAGAVAFLSGCIPGADALFPNSILKFLSVPLGYDDHVVVPLDYTARPFLPWGTPILPGTGSEVLPTTAAEQEKRTGLGHDGMWYFPLNSQGTRGVLCINQEFGDNSHIANAPGAPAVGTAAFVALSQAVHGVAVVEIRLTDSGWQPVVSTTYNRRITPRTRVTFSGPVAGTEWLENPAGNPPRGTVNNCANGKTPWGTYLTCEENFNGYFGVKGVRDPEDFDDADPNGKEQEIQRIEGFEAQLSEAEERYGFSALGFGYEWDEHDDRFAIGVLNTATGEVERNTAYDNEKNRFGWVVEIDPMDPTAAPVKRTALGRFKHENVEIVVGSDNRIVAYMGDDERFDYFYKFVSARDYRTMLAAGQSPLDEGTLYVARFDPNGRGEWLELSPSNPVLSDWTLPRILVHTRLAADILGATPMDRPEWVTAHPDTGELFFSCTNNSRRKEANVANPRTPNESGHIIRLEDDDDHLGTRFDWSIFLLAGDVDDPERDVANGFGPTIAAYDKFSDPDGMWFDPDGRLWIQTDGGQPDGANDQMLAADPATGEIRRFLTGVPDCEITGVTMTPDGTTMFINVQHPGDGDPASSQWPHMDGVKVPRDATVVITRDDGGRIGT